MAKKQIIHSPNPNLTKRHPYNRKTWSCKCGTINEPEAPECKMILLLERDPSLAKSLRGTKTHSIQRAKRKYSPQFEAKIKKQVAEVDAWLYSTSID